VNVHFGPRPSATVVASTARSNGRDTTRGLLHRPAGPRALRPVCQLPHRRGGKSPRVVGNSQKGTRSASEVSREARCSGTQPSGAKEEWLELDSINNVAERNLAELINVALPSRGGLKNATGDHFANCGRRCSHFQTRDRQIVGQAELFQSLRIERETGASEWQNVSYGSRLRVDCDRRSSLSAVCADCYLRQVEYAVM
jgi:hypothetical protein